MKEKSVIPGHRISSLEHPVTSQNHRFWRDGTPLVFGERRTSTQELDARRREHSGTSEVGRRGIHRLELMIMWKGRSKSRSLGMDWRSS